MMIVIPTVRIMIMVPTLVLVAACGAGLVFGIMQARRERSVEAGAVTAAPTTSQRSSGVRDPGLGGLAQAKAEATAVMSALDASPSAPDGGNMPVFDIARIASTGEAVIAGRAAPGATVELLLDGKVYDQAIADQSGQFVMTPPRLPAGDYRLTLRSKQPDGSQVTSIQSVMVALHPSQSDPSQAYQLSQPASQIAKGRESAASQQEKADPTAVTSSLGGGSPSSKAVRKRAIVVTGGDSLWRISRVNFGNGERYSVIYNANRNQIRDPNRIYPGEMLVIPNKAR
jgi:nucleoid-associated protein YgaU